MTSLVDFHCHLDLFPDFENLIIECENKKIHTLTVTNTPLAWPRNFALTKDKKYVQAALGLHPQLVYQRALELSVWDEYFAQATFIGEIGLDAGPAYYRSFIEQTKVFDHIVNRCATEGNKILTVHSVRAATQVLDIIEQHKANINNRIILHWFSGNIAQAKRGIKLGCFFSVNSMMLNNIKNHELLKILPLNRILTETDGPFNKLNNIPLKPEDVSMSIEMISNILNKTKEEIKSIILNNLFELKNI